VAISNTRTRLAINKIQTEKREVPVQSWQWFLSTTGYI